jgi:hypothetical protein
LDSRICTINFWVSQALAFRLRFMPLASLVLRPLNLNWTILLTFLVLQIIDAWCGISWPPGSYEPIPLLNPLSCLSICLSILPCWVCLSADPWLIQGYTWLTNWWICVSWSRAKSQSLHWELLNASLRFPTTSGATLPLLDLAILFCDDSCLLQGLWRGPSAQMNVITLWKL